MGQARQRQAAQGPPEQADLITSITKHVKESGAQRARQHTAGLLLFAGLAYVCGAAPWCLPALFSAFTLVAMPWRAVSFVRQRWGFYLLDFCYWANAAVLLQLLLWPDCPRALALVYALADGPLAAALAAWQCPWVLGSAEHTVSVLMHLLPGLAMFAHRWFPAPPGWRGWRGMLALARGAWPAAGSLAQSPRVPPPSSLAAWLVAAPLAFYLAWQLVYWLVVQVACRGYIRAHRLETSYTCLAARAAKTNNIWNRLVRRGSVARRVAMYGALQLGFTLAALAAFLPTWASFRLALAYQVVKLVLPLWHGSVWQLTKAPQHALLAALAMLQEEAAGQARAPGEAPAAAAAAAAAVAAAAKSPLTRSRAAAGLSQRRGSSCAAEVPRQMPAPPRMVA